jgi:hypothetical protein
MSNLPPQVAAAIERGDTYALQLMGRKGGRVTQRRRDILRSVESELKERCSLELYERARTANEDLVPVDDTSAGKTFFHEED